MAEDYWDRKLDNWARCYLGGANLLGSSLDLDKMPIETRERLAAVWEEPAMVVLLGDAHDTDTLIQKLVMTYPKNGYYEAIKAWYWMSGTKEFIAKRLGIHRVTLWERVRSAKSHLTDLQFQARRNLLKREVEGAIGTQPVVKPKKDDTSPCALATNVI